MRLWLILAAFGIALATPAAAQEPVQPTAAATPTDAAQTAPPQKRPWYEALSIRGYSQVRYNNLAITNEKLINGQGDKTIGGKNGFSIRRARVILSGDVHEQLSVYLQPDFASSIGEQLNVAIVRDWYADVFLTADKTWRVRVGQSKIPFGFENMQSSSNRLALDRADGLNSATRDERDIGAFVYYAPTEARQRFKYLVDSGLKGSGDYGALGFGLFNGQTNNALEKNRTPHAVARVAWPFRFGDQYVECAFGGFYGEFSAKRDKDVKGQYAVTEARVHATLVVYPQPLGFQAEYNVGVGPELRDGVVDSHPLHGGYAQVFYKAGNLIPFIKAQVYDGGRKHETNAPPYEVKELELGLEWQVHSALELVGQYTISQRSSPSKPFGAESGQFGRLQLQFSY